MGVSEVWDAMGVKICVGTKKNFQKFYYCWKWNEQWGSKKSSKNDIWCKADVKQQEMQLLQELVAS